MQRKIMNELLLKADYIYVHSIYLSQYILPFYKTKQVITDLHGVVPEEVLELGSNFKSWYYNKIEKFVVKNSTMLITVSKNMSDHLIKKYHKIKANIISLPIIKGKPSFLNKQFKKVKNFKPKVIYSGGIQLWQNIDLMLSSIKKTINKYDFQILTGNPEIMQEKANKEGLKIKINSVNTNELIKYYKNAHFGFILRDDNILNRVAFPTKLIEYITNGIVPIVLKTEIGDFKRFGYKYITLQDFLEKKIDNLEKEYSSKQKNNFNVLLQLCELYNRSTLYLKAFINKKNSTLLEKNKSSLKSTVLFNFIFYITYIKLRIYPIFFK